MISTYPPTYCGIATFAAALRGGLVSLGDAVDVVRVGAVAGDPTTDIAAELFSSPGVLSEAALDVFRRADLVLVQHEYGIYDGRDGESIVQALEAIDCPSIVVAHTVLERPTDHQRIVLERIARLADALVVMTNAGRSRLRDGFDIEPAKISVISHGAAVSSVIRSVHTATRPRLLTWGLLGPGKGIEWAIDALALLRDLDPMPMYQIAGNTHPKVAELEGNRYRDMLIRRATDRMVSGDVQFDARYRTLPELGKLISDSSIVILPYDSPDQVTSGVLVDAIAAGRPVIATAFPHAVELLSSGAGLVVPRRDPTALAAAIRTVMSSPRLADLMSAEARRLAPSLAWPSIAARYGALGESLLQVRSPVSASR